MVYYTSDLHFGHENVIKFADRPFMSVEQMNEALIENWNKKIKGCDTVYILGDMFFRCALERVEDILSKLKGKKHLIIGNHDGSWMSKIDANLYFKSTDLMVERSIDNHGTTLCHYPLVTWKHALKTYMIHGHIHNDTSTDYWNIIKNNPRILNAAVEINNYEPVTFDELVINNNKWKSESM